MLSILTRAGADANPIIFDLLLCLAGQNDMNFEWIILSRPGFTKNIEALMNHLEVNSELKNRTQIVETGTDSRGGNLNIGLEHTRGDYLTVVDDDDVISSNFVSIYNESAKLFPNSIIRTIASRKLYSEVDFYPAQPIASTRAEFIWAREFDLIQHIQSNQTPTFSVAFPVNMVRKYSINWDPTLIVVEDWDFLMKAASKIQINQISECVGIYRQRQTSSRSKTNEKISDWMHSESVVRDRISETTFPLLGREILHISGNKTLTKNAGLYRVRFEILAYKISKKIYKYPKIYLLGRRVYRATRWW